MKKILNNKFFVIFLAPFLIGALATISFAPYNLTFVNFFSFSILLFLILIVKKRTQSIYRKKRSNRYFFYLGCAFGFGFFLFGNYWISISLTHDETFKALIPFALFIIPLLLSIFFGLTILIIGPLIEKNIYFILLFSLVFSFFEFLRGNILSGFPWNLISYTWSWSPESLQILSIIGVYSLIFISVTFFCTPFIFFQKKILKKNIIFLFIIILIFISNYFYGSNRIDNNNYLYDKNISIKIVSPSISLEDYKYKTEISQLEKLIKISNPNKNKKTIFIWPEGLFYESYLQDLNKYKNLFINNFSENHLIVLGINNREKNKYFNSLVVLNSKLEILSVYNKINLVPFGEFLPLKELLSQFGLKKITKGYNSFSSGNERLMYNLGNKFSNKNILPLICYEIIYSGRIKNHNQLPDLIINISEDAWFGNSIGPYQHFSKAIYRAIEEGVFIARSTNKGISAFIDPSGKVIKSLNTRESGNLEVYFPHFYKKTLFSIYGNKLFFLIIFLYILFFLILRKLKI